MTPNPLRQFRAALGLSQSAFAARLGVAPETYRTWDAGRRPAPENILTQARALGGQPDDQELLPMAALASMLGVHVRTLQMAARLGSLDTPPDMEIYLPDSIFPEAAITLLVKTTQDPPRAVADIRARITHIDREAFVSDMRAMTDLISESLASRVFTTLLLTICAGVALALALSGIYSIVSQATVQRKLEIGIRIALGATPRRIMALMLQRATLPVIAGAAIGLAGTLATAHLLAALLFGIQPFDPLTFAAATVMFSAVAFVSAVIPARRATRVDPLVALRCE
jgi:transcriptional regulator with XRE-family HTH domain